MAKKSARPTSGAVNEPAVDVSALTFEQAYAELAVVVEKLEDAGLTLEESLALHARGRALAAHCAWHLEHAELRVRQWSASE